MRPTINRNTVSQDIVPSIPADGHPIKFISDYSFYIMRSPESPSNNNKPLSLINFIQLKPEWDRILIENFQENTNVDFLFQFLTNKNELLIASDRSKQEERVEEDG